MQLPRATLPTLLQAPATFQKDRPDQDRLERARPWELVVKRTFLEVQEDSLLERASSLRRSRSAPTRTVSSDMSGLSEGFETSSFDLDARSRPLDMPASPSDLQTSDSSFTEAEDQNSFELDPTPAGSSPHSVGSAGHASGDCKPCAWFWKPEGCQNDKDCLHCHFCPAGEVNRRKKLHKAMKWQQQQARLGGERARQAAAQQAAAQQAEASRNGYTTPMLVWLFQ
mmetsp:Transcript_73799/g.130377  ORF Transcript_73799/g.130377 Transcript_73799/m.130377 type:complete len:226 (-) Transcript_73799:395-1072(-)|eukprot:CAMPEP_0197653322 /NCGR_PEP_ID=MMETSP1338-20131121/35019_1 /TAXON_ID=43686 ORGANISM="Pelagodinium beii, Strain RCC1491" /NCGR_SAMPLE_ID=MMETSP1338 /ASSEMBLY_ACC=CAM_ASM_000754 /LENGTH=225 /DNA_ID=CAMNT_0043228379 /DNA_START=51 /DNA_END=728 /DNA_ORIENTATION=+